ncbi:MAG: MlaD family protein [Prevotella sp.]
MKAFTKEVKIALVAIIGVIVLFFGLNFLKGLNLFSSTNDYIIEFEDISGLSSSSPIYAGGFQVGTVKGVEYNYDNASPIKVIMAIDKQMRIPEGSSAKIESDMLGNVKVNLILAKNVSSAIQPGGTIKGFVDGGAMGQLSEMIPTVEKILPKLDSIMANLNTLMADPAIAQSLHNVNTITADLTTSTKELNILMRNINKNMPQMLVKTNNILDNTNQLTSNLAGLDIASTMEEVNQTIANVQTLTAKLNSNEGTLGLLMNDSSIYYNVNNTLISTNKLLEDLREHPKRYVHFSLFGRKDK